jgi:hypothetical protein
VAGSSPRGARSAAATATIGVFSETEGMDLARAATDRTAVLHHAHTLPTDVTMPLGHRPQIDRQAGVADSSSPCRPGGCGRSRSHRSRSHRPDQEPSPPGSAPVSFSGFRPDGGSQAIGRRGNAGAAGWLRAPRSRKRGIGRWRGGRGLRPQLWGGCDAGQLPACGRRLG